MSGEMLGRGKHSARMSSANIGRDHFSDLLRVFAKRACIDDRVCRIGIHIGNRKEIPMDTDRARLLTRDLAKGLRVLDFSRRAKSHGGRKNGGSVQVSRQTAFKI